MHDDPNYLYPYADVFEDWNVGNSFGPHIMVDIETLGTNANAPIVAIGAVRFGVKDEEQVPGVMPNKLGVNYFYQRIRLQSAMRVNGAKADGGTIAFWMQQPEAARMHLYAEGGKEAGAVLSQFKTWVTGISGVVQYMWSHGATFDIPLLGQWITALDRTAKYLGIDYHNYRDTRTIFDVVSYLNPKWVMPGPIGIKHHALADAISQARQVQAAYAELRRLTGKEYNALGSDLAAEVLTAADRTAP